MTYLCKYNNSRMTSAIGVYVTYCMRVRLSIQEMGYHSIVWRRWRASTVTLEPDCCLRLQYPHSITSRSLVTWEFRRCSECQVHCLRHAACSDIMSCR